MVMSLTLPQPPTPTIVHAGRSNLTLQWTSDYFPASQLQLLRQASSGASSAGFNLTVCEVDAVAAAAQGGLLGGASSKQDGAVQGCAVTSWSSREFSSSPWLSAAASPHAGAEAVQFRASVLGLRPDTAHVARWVRDPLINRQQHIACTYCSHVMFQSTTPHVLSFIYVLCRLALFYENAGGQPSPWSEAARTAPLSSPSAAGSAELLAECRESDPTTVRLEFDQPVDDGGMEILGYVSGLHMFLSLSLNDKVYIAVFHSNNKAMHFNLFI
jgi:hypothetical protein